MEEIAACAGRVSKCCDGKALDANSRGMPISLQAVTEYLARNWPSLAGPLAILLFTLLAGFILRGTALRALERWASRTQSQADDILVDSVRGPFLLWALILGIHLATQVSQLPPRASAMIAKTLLILWIISLTIAASRLAGRLVQTYGDRAQGVLPVTSLSRNLARLVVASIGLLILLNVLGVSITPILTALGVGGLAVALALQETLANFFSGFYISAANQIRIGDYIKLDTGEEGYVTDISWRNSSIRMLSNNLVIVPNSKLAQAIVTNYHLPEKRMSLLIPVSVAYGSDPDVVEKLLIEEAKAAAGEVSGLLADPAPFVRFIPGFGEYALGFTLICQVQEFTDQYVVQHELRKRILRRLRRDGIEIPFPTQTVHLQERNAPPQ